MGATGRCHEGNHRRERGKQMKERLDVLLVNTGACRIQRKGKGHHHVRESYIVARTEGRQGWLSCLRRLANIEVRRRNPLKYVSRGGLKLEKAMTHFGVDTGRKSMHGCRCLHRRLYRLHACRTDADEGLRRGCGPRTAGTGNCAMMSGWSAWKRPISVM